MHERIEIRGVVKGVKQEVGGIQIVTWKDNGHAYALGVMRENDGFKVDDDITVTRSGLRIVDFQHTTSKS